LAHAPSFPREGPQGATGDAGACFGNPGGLVALRERSPAPWSLAGSGASRPAGCLPAPALRRFVSRWAAAAPGVRPCGS